MKKILVTGGAGFIGSNFILWLLKHISDAYVINLDALTYAGNLANLVDVERDPRYQFIRCDITDAKAVQSVFQSTHPEIVVHFAAESHVDRSILDAGAFIRTNIVGTQILLEACRDAKVSLFCHISTDEVYGSLGPNDPPFQETTPLSPRSPYAASKAGADLLVLSYVHTHRFPAIITRCSNNYGPYQFPEKFIPLFITNALDDQPLPLYGDGKNIRDWIHVRDHCAGIWAAITRGQPGEVYNFGASNEQENIEIAYKLLAILGKPKSLIRFVKDRPGHDRRYAMGYEKAERELGWRPTLSFEEGLRETVRWYCEHRKWWEEIKTGAYLDYYKQQYGERI